MDILQKSRLLTLLVMSVVWGAYIPKAYSDVFLVGFPENQMQEFTILSITVTNSDVSAIVVLITSSFIRKLDEFVLTPASSKTIVVSGKFMVKGSTKTKQGIRISTNGTAQVYIEEESDLNSKEATVVIPEQFLGHWYTVVSGTSSAGATNSQILIVGVTDNTNVTVTIKATSPVTYDHRQYFSDNKINVMLNEFDTVQIQCQSSDLTGTSVVASSPISVFSGNKEVQMDTESGFLFEQMPAGTFWQTLFVTIPPSGATYDCKIVAAFPNTLVQYRCDVFTIQRHQAVYVNLDFPGSHVTLQLGSNMCMVIANEPIMITMIIYAVSRSPSMVVLPPIQDVYEDIVFYVPKSMDFAEILFVTKTEDIGNIALDNGIVTNLNMVQMQPDYVVVFGDIGSGTHIISSSRTFQISGYIYGWLGSKAFGYSLGFGTFDTNTIAFEMTTVFSDDGPNNSETETTTKGKAVATDLATSELKPETEAIFRTSSNVQTTAAMDLVPTESSTETTVDIAGTTPGPSIETKAASHFETSEQTTKPLTTTLGRTTETRYESPVITERTSERLTKTSTIAVTKTSSMDDIYTVGNSDVTRYKTTTAIPSSTVHDTTSSAPEIQSSKPMLCGTTKFYPSENIRCYDYCANHTRDVNILLHEMRANLIDRKTTRRYLRSLTSVLDNRMSAQTIGYTGVIVLVSVILFILILDIKTCKSKKRGQGNQI